LNFATRSKPISLTAQTTYYLNYNFAGSGTNISGTMNATNSNAVIFAEPADI
jgi:hypothetical protein